MLPFMRQVSILLLCLSAVLAEETPQRNHKKRQIYREQVLPHAGGKIPETAFETDRLFLNRLQKEGIALPDGILPEQRSPQTLDGSELFGENVWDLNHVYQYYQKPSRTVLHIALSSDGRYTPREGRYNYRQVPTVETTYLYPQAVDRPYVLVPPKHALPVYRQLQLHNPLLNQIKFQPRKTPNSLDLGKSNVVSSPYKAAQSYQNVNLNLLHASPPLLPAFKKTASGSKTYVDSYGTTHLFTEFDDYFNKFDLHRTAAQTFY